MPEKTGKSLQEWIVILRKHQFDKHSHAVNFLKKEHGVTHGFANTIVTLSKDNTDTPDDLVSNQYKGKEALIPIYEKLISEISTFAKDLVITPKKTTVSLITKKQFALIKPATKTRIDLGLKLTGIDVTERLENSGPFGTMCTHRVRLESLEQVDKELIDWLKKAYKASSKQVQRQ